MSHKFAILLGMTGLFFAFASTQSVAAPATCLKAHCAVVGGGVAAPALPPVLVATGAAVPLHPVVGVYCVLSSAVFLKGPVVPLVSVADDLSLPLAPAAGTSPAASLAEINFAAKGCPPPVAGKPPFIQVDTYQIIPGAGPPITVPSDNVGFLVQF